MKKFELKVKGRDNKEYKAYFKPLQLDDYDGFLSYINNNPDKDEDDILELLVKNYFVEGDKEILDTENRYDLFNSYKTQLYNLLDVKYVETEEKGLETIITAYDIDISVYPYINSKMIKKDKESNTAEIKYSKDETLKDIKYYEAKFRYPKKSEYKRYRMAYDSGNVVSSALALAKMCYVEGSKELIESENASFIYSATKYFSDILRVDSGELKKK